MTLAVCALPGPGDAQIVHGVVAEQVSLEPSAGAVVMLMRVASPDSLEPVAMTTADETGVYAFETPGPGAFRVRAERDGLSSALSAVLELSSPDHVADVPLLMPSVLLRMALECEAEAVGTAVVGVVWDTESDVSLPGAVVTASWQAERQTRMQEAETDGAGRYRFCGLPSEGRVSLRARFFGGSGPPSALDLAGPSVVFHDLELTLRANGANSDDQDPIRQHILMEAAATGLGDLGGEVLDRESGAPVPYVVVRLGDTPHQAFTDQSGRFRFEGLAPGFYRLEVRGLGYEATSSPLEIPAGKDVFVGLRLAPQALELEGLEVTGRSAVEEIARVSPFRRDIVYGQAMAIEEERGALAYEILRRSTSGIRVSERHIEGGPPILCIEANRRVANFTGGCANVQVVVDGMRIPDGPDFLRNTPALMIESIEYISPVQAQILFGIGGSTSNGVVAVYTRGKGPYASPMREGR